MPAETKAPPATAPKAEHKRHAAEFLARTEHTDPRKVNKPEYRDVTEEARE
jgi:hypothetical protein